MSGRFVYPPAILEAMFDAVETDDLVDPVVSLPEPIPVACEGRTMRRCLDLCVQFWREGAIRSDLLALTSTLLLTGDLTPDARRRYKLIRARYKHLRFALVLYGTRHRVPPLFGATVAVMGHLQDAFRNRRRTAVFGHALLLRLLLCWPVWLAVRREVYAVRLDDAQGFRRFRAEEMERLGTWLAQAPPTSHRFHAMRKIVSRQVAFYDTLRTLAPDDRVFRMSRYLAAINGLMGSLHDDLVEGAASGSRDYRRDPVPLPEDIRTRLHTLTEAYPVN